MALLGLLACAGSATDEVKPRPEASRVANDPCSGLPYPAISLLHTGWAGGQPVIAATIGFSSAVSQYGYAASSGGSYVCLVPSACGSFTKTFTTTTAPLGLGECGMVTVTAYNQFGSCRREATESITVCSRCPPGGCL